MQLSAQIKLKLLILLFAISISPFRGMAQAEEWFTSDTYLSSSLIDDVLYDSEGMLWVATEDGLNRFDGSKFTIYHNDPQNPHSIAANRVNSIFEDHDGNIFVCTHSGVQIYDRAADSFSRPLTVKGTGGDSSPLQNLLQFSDGELWAIGNEVYRIVDIGSNPALEHPQLPDQIRFVAGSIVDDQDNIWLTKHPNILFRISRDGKVNKYFGQPDEPTVTSSTKDANGNIYVGTQRRGVYRYNAKTDTFESLDLGERINRFVVSSLYSDDFGNVLIGTDGGGLFVYNPKNQSVEQFPFSNPDYRKLKIHGITKDDSGNLWVGAFQKGLLRQAPLTSFFKSIDQRLSNIIGSCCVTAICRDAEGRLWVGTDNDDVFVLDLQNNTSRHFTEKVPASVMSLFEDSSGRMWLGSYNRGFGMIDKHTGQYTDVPLKRNGLDVSHVYDFAQLADGNMLLATMGAGLFLFNPETKEAKSLDFPDFCEWITSLKINPDTHEIYVGTYDGLFVISPDLKDVKQVLQKNIISTIHVEPSHHDIWLGTSQGLVRLDTDLQLKRTYTQADGLPSLSVLAIEHGDDALWLSTTHGLSKFDVVNDKFTNYNVSNGLPNNEFSRNASFKDAEGNFFFGGVNGLTMFRSDMVKPDNRKLTLRITDFMIDDKNVDATTRSGHRQVIDVPLAHAKTFRLSHEDNTFTVSINTREFINSSNLDYYYSFDDSEWTRLQPAYTIFGGVTLTFSNVSSGRHTLRVKALNGTVESDTLKVTIDIAPVWYASWWAWLIYLLISAAIVYWIMRIYRERRDRKRQQEHQRQQQEILESKLQFFTNISHEIRTPLSLVIGPLQKLQETDSDPKRVSSYHVILRNANRILRLVNELMDLRKIDNRQMKLHCTQVNLTALTHDLYETFQQAASSKNITFVYNHQGGDDLMVWVDVTHFDKVIMNLLSNAMKFTPENGSVIISLASGYNPDDHGPLSEYAEISVTDSGIGISEEDRKRVFDRFFQGSNNKMGGTGIGLHLTRQIVELHHGTISISDNPDGQGTKFIVRIPLGNEHLNEDEIVVTPTADKQEDTVMIQPRMQVMQQFIEPTIKDKSKISASRTNEVVYVVEDDEDIRKYLVDSLNRYFHAYGYSNGKLALEAIHRQCPDLVITDVMMPEMDGYTLTKKIKQNININRTPVIILTAKTREEDNLDAIESGATVYISKPFNIDVVVRTAQNLIEGVARLRNAFSGNQSQEERLVDIEATSNDDKLMERVMKVINKNLSNADITVEMIAREIGISRVHLHRKLKEITNQSTRDFIRNIRLQAAAKLLREKRLTVAEVSDLVGFKHPNNFATVFKDMFGLTPTAYSAKYHDETDTAEADSDAESA